MDNETYPAHPAFPVYCDSGDDYRGLSKREYFAALAMQGLISRGVNSPEVLVDAAVQIADALLSSLSASN